jgi:hypothetical protein
MVRPPPSCVLSSFLVECSRHDQRGQAREAGDAGAQQRVHLVSRWAARAGRTLEPEDLLLALWLGVLEPLIRRYTGEDLLPLIETLDLRLMEVTWDTTWAWVAQPGVVMSALLAITLVPLAIVVFTRSSDAAGQDVPRSRPGSWRAPFLPTGVRRALVLPVALLGESLIREVSRGIAADRAANWPTAAAVHVVFAVLPFVLLVVGPRVAAGASTVCQVWAGRFALFYAAWWAGALAGW